MTLSALYYNARSIIPRLDELRLICSDTTPDIVCIVETWLRDSISDSELTINGYNLVRRDRNRHGGGVMLYIRDNPSFCVVYNDPENLELLSVKLFDGQSLRCVCALYVPPVSVYTDLHSLFLFLHQAHFSKFVLIGDFNVDYLDSSSPLYHSLQTILNNYCLTQVVQEPTRVCVSGKASMIDLALLSNPSLLQSCCQLGYTLPVKKN